MKPFLMRAFLSAIILTALYVTSASAQGGVYTVQPGDTLYSIASRYGISVEQLTAVNRLTQDDWIYQGQQLAVPNNGAMYTSAQPGYPPSNNAAYGVNQAPAYGQSSQSGYQPQAGYAPQPTNNYQTASFSYPQNAPQAYPQQPANSYYPQGSAAGYPQQSAYNNNYYNNYQQSATAAPQQAYRQPGAAANSYAAAGLANGSAGEKWIDIDLSRQMVTAYEGQAPVFKAIVSTGANETPTVVGTYSIYVKHRQSDMSGGSGADAYYAPNVPYVMYFNGGYGLHGTYWHDYFGMPVSHGCINMTIPDSEWLYNWAEIGTKVVSHY